MSAATIDLAAARSARPDFTVRQKILLAAASLGDATFTVERLIVRAWERFPESFALRGFEAQHPDSNRVYAKLSGHDGLVGLGWAEHADQRMYRVSREGWRVVRQLTAIAQGDARRAEAESPQVEQAPEPRVEKPARTKAVAAPAAHAARLADGELRSLTTIARSDVLRKFLRGSPLTFADACAFWGVKDSMRPDVVQARVDAVGDVLRRALEAFGGDAADPRMPTLATCYGLFNVDRIMRERFARELSALTVRSGA